MQVKPHQQQHYAATMRALLPPGAAWQWSLTGDSLGLGGRVLLSQSAELARIESEVQGLLDSAVEAHRRGWSSWHIDAYRRVAWDALRPMLSDADADAAPEALVKIDHLVWKPLTVSNAFAGALVWSAGARLIQRVRYAAVLAPEQVQAIKDALLAFRQSHIEFWFEEHLEGA